MNQLNQRPVTTLMAKYAESHRHPANEIIHFICVPAILASLIGLCWSIHPMAALAAVVLSLAYYLTLSAPFAFGMLCVFGAILSLLGWAPQTAILPGSVAVFVIAWIGQFIGHKIEGKKPSFFDDIRFLLIGPLFVLGFLYRRLRIAY